jgi:hypothetical protein
MAFVVHQIVYGKFTSNAKESRVIKKRYGIVVAVVVAVCMAGSANAKRGSACAVINGELHFAAQLQAPEWVLYGHLSDDGKIISFNKAGDDDEAFELCQSEGGDVGSLQHNTQGGAFCDTQKGAMDTFYVLHHYVPRPYGAVREREGGNEDLYVVDYFAPVSKGVVSEHLYFSVLAEVGMLPDYDWTDQEKRELAASIRISLEGTGAWQRFLTANFVNATEGSAVPWNPDLKAE